MAAKKTTKKSSTPKTKTTVTKGEGMTIEAPKVEEVVTAGDRECYVYAHVNLTKDARIGEIISLSLVDADGRSIYIEFTDYNAKNANTLVVENTINTLLGEDNDKGINTVVTDSADARIKVFNWLYIPFKEKQKVIQFVMDKVSWDWPIFGEFIKGPDDDFPAWISPVIIDLNTELASNITVAKDKALAVANGEGTFDNFVPAIIVNRDLDRVETAKALGLIPENILSLPGNNALKMAFATRAIHQNMWGISKG